jgi:hypothetical protein
MNDQMKMILALQQINNITELVKDNEYERFLYGKLISVRVELERQLTNITYHSNIKE